MSEDLVGPFELNIAGASDPTALMAMDMAMANNSISIASEGVAQNLPGLDGQEIVVS